MSNREIDREMDREIDRERERERERDACDVIDIKLNSRVIMHMITSTARRHVAFSA